MRDTWHGTAAVAQGEGGGGRAAEAHAHNRHIVTHACKRASFLKGPGEQVRAGGGQRRIQVVERRIELGEPLFVLGLAPRQAELSHLVVARAWRQRRADLLAFLVPRQVCGEQPLRARPVGQCDARGSIAVSWAHDDCALASDRECHGRLMQRPRRERVRHDAARPPSRWRRRGRCADRRRQLEATRGRLTKDGHERHAPTLGEGVGQLRDSERLRIFNR